MKTISIATLVANLSIPAMIVIAAAVILFLASHKMRVQFVPWLIGLVGFGSMKRGLIFITLFVAVVFFVGIGLGQYVDLSFLGI